jgi:peptidyl-tRNA hydrolase, PTH2 family
MKYKQVIILRTDLKMKTGKKVAQGCHASLIAYQLAKRQSPGAVNRWQREGQRKIALKIRTKEKLVQIYQQAKDLNLPASLVQDAGLTQLEPGSKTAVGIGPALESKIDRITGNLKLL